MIDRSLTFIGSMNVLAHVPGGRHETMAFFQSATLAERILEHERVDELADPPRCPKCDADVRHVRTLGGANLGKLHWTCTTTRDGDKCGWTKPFSDRPKTRNSRDSPPLGRAEDDDDPAAGPAQHLIVQMELGVVVNGARAVHTSTRWPRRRDPAASPVGGRGPGLGLRPGTRTVGVLAQARV